MSYFSGSTKRGELKELKDELRSAKPEKKKEAVKRVIAAMTIGTDVSELFPDVVNCMQTANIELKKLVYLYIINYAKAQPELAILAINTFRKDTTNQNPLIRALAVRTMGCIRLPQVTEYLTDPLKLCCNDEDPYVRKTAAICVAKLFDISPDMVAVHGFVEQLQKMLSDANPMVVANAVAALAEIHHSDPSLKALRLNDDSVPKLLAALNECTEWGQVFILEALAEYTPPDAMAAESILDRVGARLQHANPAVVMTAVRVVLRLLDMIESQEVVTAYSRKLSPPLVTLLSQEPELQYVALRNISLIVQKRPELLQNEVRMFFCRYNDPPYVKNEKLEIVCRLASEKNADQILLELKEYAQEVDTEFVRKAVRAIGRVAVKLEAASQKALKVILDLVETKVPHVVQESVVVVRDIFRRYPDRYEEVILELCKALNQLDEPNAKAALIWMLGEYANRIQNAHELLQSFVDGTALGEGAPATGGFSDEPTEVQLQILTAAVKIFLRSPKTATSLVQRVLALATQESDNPDLRDRGYIYWRLLSSDPRATREVTLAPRPPISGISDGFDANTLRVLLSQIGSLASVYHKPPVAFVPGATASSQAAAQVTLAAKKPSAGGANFLDLDEDDEAAKQQKLEKARRRMAGEADSEDEDSPAPQSGKVKTGGANLLDFDDDDEDEGRDDQEEVASASPFPPSAPAAAPQPPAYEAKKLLVLKADAAGHGGKSGLAVIAHAGRDKSGRPAVFMAVKNMSAVAVDGWSVEVKADNPYGMSAVSPNLPLGSLAPGATGEATVLLKSTGKRQALPAQGGPLFLQIGLKSSLDVFFFFVSHEADLLLGPALQPPANAEAAGNAFRGKWASFSDPATQQISMMFQTTSGSPLPSIVNAGAQKTALAARGYTLWTARTGPTFECAYLEAQSISLDEPVLLEVASQTQTNLVKITAKSNNLALARAAIINVAKAMETVPQRAA